MLVAQLYLTLCDPMDWSLPGFSVHAILQARIQECHFLFQGIVPTQGLNPGLLHCRQILYQLSHVNQTVKENVIIIVHHFQFNILEAAVRHENKIIYG